MKRLRGLLAALCCSLALSCTLVACATHVDMDNYTGDWTLAYGSDENLDADSLALMKSLGLEVTLTLNEDGTGALDLFGDSTPLSWEASSNTEGSLTFEGDENDITGDASIELKDGELTVVDSANASMTFTREGAEAE